MKGIYKIKLKHPTLGEQEETYFTTLKRAYEYHGKEKLGIAYRTATLSNVKKKPKCTKMCVMSYHVINPES